MPESPPVAMACGIGMHPINEPIKPMAAKAVDNPWAEPAPPINRISAEVLRMPLLLQ